MGQRAFQAGQLSCVLGQIIRKHLQTTEAQLASQIGVSPDTMTRWLNGRSSINVDHFAAIAQSLGISPEELIREAIEQMASSGAQLVS